MNFIGITLDVTDISINKSYQVWEIGVGECIMLKSLK